MRLQFLVSTVNEEVETLAQRMNLQADAIVVNQCDRNEYREYTYEAYRIRCYSFAERGVGLSGGQKQRISIARAIAKENPVLILDDSTSALDMETEKEIEGQLRRLSDCTKVIIGHRISAVRNADQILILENGRVAERGTHEELLKKKGLYYQTYQVQYGEEEMTWQ